jgi:hypothetical protein
MTYFIPLYLPAPGHGTGTRGNQSKSGAARPEKRVKTKKGPERLAPALGKFAFAGGTS